MTSPTTRAWHGATRSQVHRYPRSLEMSEREKLYTGRWDWQWGSANLFWPADACIADCQVGCCAGLSYHCNHNHDKGFELSKGLQLELSGLSGSYGHCWYRSLVFVCYTLVAGSKSPQEYSRASRNYSCRNEQLLIFYVVSLKIYGTPLSKKLACYWLIDGPCVLSRSLLSRLVCPCCGHVKQSLKLPNAVALNVVGSRKT